MREIITNFAIELVGGRRNFIAILAELNTIALQWTICPRAGFILLLSL
jgi:hypothetical protein